MVDPRLREELEEAGRVWFRQALTAEDILILRRAATTGGGPGLRLGLSDELRHILGTDGSVGRCARKLDMLARPVRGVAFNKLKGTNWGVPWHQDRLIAVRSRHEVPGFGPWSDKRTGWHVEPPSDYLSRMFFAIVHLDETGTDEGCLELALGSHRFGKTKSCEASRLAGERDNELCLAGPGDVLFAKALILHRSRPSRSGRSRRTVRVDYSADNLPNPLEWAW